MDIKLHKRATTTPRIREEIQNAPASETNTDLAKRYNVSLKTVRRWRERDSIYDRSHTARSIKTSINDSELSYLMMLRRRALLSLDELLLVARFLINSNLSRSALYRALKRKKAPTIRSLIASALDLYESDLLLVDLGPFDAKGGEAFIHTLYFGKFLSDRRLFVSLNPQFSLTDFESTIRQLYLSAESHSAPQQLVCLNSASDLPDQMISLMSC